MEITKLEQKSNQLMDELK